MHGWSHLADRTPGDMTPLRVGVGLRRCSGCPPGSIALHCLRVLLEASVAPVGGQSASGREALFFSKFYFLSSLSHSTRNIPLLFLFSLVSWLPHLISAVFPWCCWRHSVWQPFAVQLGRVIVSPCETDSEVALAKPGVLGLFQKDHRD